jgi:signal transduction histidine kinase
VNLDQTTVLVVDDRTVDRYVAAHALARAGFQVLEAETGQEALEMAKSLPAVIVMDVRLPDILGYEVCRRIKANSQTRHIPVLQLSTSFRNNESKLYALESGADAYLIRPVDPVVLVATVRALVRLHQAESHANMSARQWQATFDALSEGVAIVGGSGMVTRCNRAMTGLLGRNYREIEGHSLAGILRDCFNLEPVPECEQTNREVRVEDRFFRVRLDPVRAGGEATGSILIVAEITKQKHAEEALLINERLAATGRMAHTIAHEINNPLEAITNLLYLLQTSITQPEIAREFIDQAAIELDRVSRISRQILSFNRETSSPVELSVGELIHDVLALNNQASVVKGLEVDKEWRGSLKVHGFPAQLRQVFSNLYRNAVEASSPGGKIRIRISRGRLGDTLGAPAVRITIADQGIGIPAENRKRIFDAFFTTKDLKGSGIGLWLSSTIIRQHGGSLRVRSSTGPARSGTCMSVLLPCQAAR